MRQVLLSPINGFEKIAATPTLGLFMHDGKARRSPRSGGAKLEA
jgi:hypothetical protein